MDFKKVLVKDLYKDVNSYVGDIVEVSGWVKTVRDSKSFGFIELMMVLFSKCSNCV